MDFAPVSKIDTHLHLSLEPMPKISSYLEMLPHLDNQGIEKGIVLPAGENNKPLGSNETARLIAEAKPDRYAWMCTLDPVEPETIYDRLMRYKSQGAVGIGELMINKPLNDPFLDALFQAAGELDLPVTFHMSPEEGFSYGVVDHPGLPLLEQALQRFPHTRFVGHSGVFWAEMSADAPVDRDGRNGYPGGSVVPGGRVPELFEKYPNLYGDLSATSGGNAILRDEAFGLAFLECFQDRLFFATDMVNTGMVFPLGSWLDEMAKQGKLSEKAYRKICRENAARIYGV
jgi:predicted TIM-barrel fold metal-dependent hydrolase